jgi:23S rRNA (uridine2552-2'-O)-methyltransferase
VSKQPNRSRRPHPFIIKDKFFHKAKDAGFRARSVFKLEELDKEFKIIKEWMSICDIGAAPGSFLQYIHRIVRDTGVIVWIDLKRIDQVGGKNVYLIESDIFDFKNLIPQIETILWDRKQFDTITSDIAPNTTGRRDVDQYASVELNIEILKFSDTFLKSGGNLLLKVFKWEDFRDLTREIEKRFERFTEYKPIACRDRSMEEYVICFNKK